MEIIRRACLPFVALLVAATAKPFLQPQAQFTAAFGNASTSPSFVMITIVDARSGVSRTGCTTPATLTHAIEIERNLKPHYHLTGQSARIALAAPGHRFVFRKREALRALGFAMFERDFAKACAIIRGGQPAYQQDRSGEIRAGQP